MGEVCLADEFILETHGLTKEFAGFFAVRDVALKVRRGSIHALIGPNGAGKTTCFNLLTKFLRPSAGQILYKGQDITALAPADVARLGLVRSFQISAVFPHLTALENVRSRCSASTASPSISALQGVLDPSTAGRTNSERRGLNEFATTPAVEMPMGASARWKYSDAGARPRNDAARRADGRHGPWGHRQDRSPDQAHLGEYTILMVEHNLSVVANLSDIITVLTRGQVLAEGTYADLSGRARQEKPIWGPVVPQLRNGRSRQQTGGTQVLSVKDLQAWYGNPTSFTASTSR
jgi:branched-chain amino acid transport system ATP-binding protein